MPTFFFVGRMCWGNDRLVLLEHALRQARGARSNMVAAFSSLGAYRAHAIETGECTPSEVLAVTRRGLAEGRFRLGWQV